MKQPTKQRPPRTSVIAFSKFKKIAQTCEEPAVLAEVPLNMTKASYVELQRIVDATFVQTLAATIDTMKARTLGENDVRRTRRFIAQFVAGSGGTLPDSANGGTGLPKKIGVKNIKAIRPKTRVTSAAVRYIAALYIDIIQLAVSRLEAPSGKKRLLPADLAAQLAQTAYFCRAVVAKGSENST